MAHIITYGTMATKLAIKDVARVQKLPLSESDRLCKLVPDKIPDKKMNLPNAIAYVPELQAAEVSPDPILRDKMAVWSKDPNVNPVSACIGEHGARVAAECFQK